MSSEILDIQDLNLPVGSNASGYKENTEVIDYKMVTFSLGGKDYGIDIMKVKEISKAAKFTFVPNSIPFVKGVYNLRGDIISVIDLRVMFNLPIPESNSAPENMIILRLEDNVLGVIVDTIDKVVAISSLRIQPPHPLFGDINIKFIKGIVENDDKLYIIIDVESVFDQKSADAAMKKRPVHSSVKGAEAQIEAPAARVPGTAAGDIDYSFIVETLATFSKFSVSQFNEGWIKSRYSTWVQQRKSSGQSVQLKSGIDSDEFLSGFSSPYSGLFWDKDYADMITELLPETDNANYSAWDVGCGKGEEAYSLASALKKRYGSKRIKINANDRDLLSISTAPNLVFSKNTVPEIYDEYITEGKNGWHFVSLIKDLILFEYHDVTNGNQLPPVDLIIARDVISFQPRDDQQKLCDMFYEKLKPGGILIAGANELVFTEGWVPVGNGLVSAYRKN
ncbi:MAG: chemotaxis protein CheW [Spirochaetales bacterium]|nr:chemotaxis protein CheW [Spirochaetales bacterium]